MMKKTSTVEFRPAIPDESGSLRADFGETLRRSGLSRPAFLRKVFEFGLASMKKQIARVGEVRP